MTEKWENAEEDYNAGMKYKDIADKYDVALSTVKSWKQRYSWSRNKDAPPKKVCVQNPKVRIQKMKWNRSLMN